ncbi:MAG: 2-oxoacid:ferredoxin oxidoreductase subunit beta [Bacteroidales bacterium]|mgnify:FL=1|jgi:2-oxoglutarate ferredoxin oxidoreductase subunit beta|nr:2-oxoacid:ferredoxin oxidoreductase subunit beta [Bacteroidales bacterium]NLP20908.1 2-oxoacid:ferredoxin oxidoreductase subunit beta [Bacteroidales bacterium]OQC44952.1 MAG: 2-oxoglutarate oxidoreductase subunit KorB [Bacteroidetes bacterium ADurb.Bin028]HNY44966.1 2-oxoacid:ferredoxin oxidoreductase subunit beta [Bacteroidales bacterium]HOD89244.1 2-oxoacid:ferredoxin oxidoreductase subunit beta [Bacteroidales bacterium]
MAENKYTVQDFKSSVQVRWCPGCGDFSVLASVQKAMSELNYKKEDYAVISGIGCSSRFPYYMNTYGFHGIHGRAGVLASGVKVANPKLSVWQITGDGDALAIGGNHFIHEIRRNIDLNVILFNNEIYGLTKGQYSPTSKFGQITNSSPFGTIEKPFNAGRLTLGAGGNFFARTIDANVKETVEILKAADQHKGTAIVEVLQNCVIFNNGAHQRITDKEERENNQLWLEHGKPMIFGKDRNKGLVLDGLKLKVVTIGENGITEKDILVHDMYEEDLTLHTMLVNLNLPDFPVVFGIVRAVKAATYNDLLYEQIAEVQSKSSIKGMDDVFNSGSTWEV